MSESITPCLWYDQGASEAAEIYCKAFARTKVTARSPIVTEISIDGQSITLLDGGPMYKPNASISLFYVCDTREDFDRAWKTLTPGGMVMMAADKYPWSEYYGFIADKFGVAWQISLGKLSDVGQRVTPCFMFVGSECGRAEEAINYYKTIFSDVKVGGILKYGKDESPDKPGTIKHAQLSMNSYKFMFMDSAAPHKFKFTEGVSLTVHCHTQERIDHYWNKLTESGGEESMCGWLKDRFGVSWQIVPVVLSKIMSDPAKAGKAARAFMSMRKLDIEQIVQASLS